MVNKINTAVIIGAGNIARHLGKLFVEKGVQVLSVAGKDEKSVHQLASDLNSNSAKNIADLPANPDLILIAVPDDAIEMVVSQLNVSDSIVAHTSGTVDLVTLQEKYKHCGVFYPLQTFSPESRINWAKVPVCIEASNGEVLQSLEELAKRFSGVIHNISSEDRKTLHLAAVIVNNFTNYLYNIAFNILEKEGLPADILKPLISETADKISKIHPAKAQTGPAMRGDIKTLEQHLKRLENESDYQEIYRLISQQILTKLSKKNEKL